MSGWEAFGRAQYPPLSWRQFATDFGLSKNAAKRMVRERERDEIWMNNLYQVAINRLPGVPETGQLIHLSIKRLDKQPIHDWRDLQRIKTELVGPECEAIEIYPAESRLIDGANQFHLWAYANPTFRFPWGFNGPREVDNDPGGGAVQRRRD